MNGSTLKISEQYSNKVLLLPKCIQFFYKLSLINHKSKSSSCFFCSFKESERLEVRICKPNCANPFTPCINKCCEYDEVYSLGMNGKRGGCLKLDPLLNETLWSPVFYEKLNTRLGAEEMKSLQPHVIHNSPTSFKPQCTDKLTTVYPYGEKVVKFLNR